MVSKWSAASRSPLFWASSILLALQTRHRHPAQSCCGTLGVRCLPCLLPPRLALVPGTVQTNEFLKLVLKGLPEVIPPHSGGEGGHGTHPLLPPSLAMICVWWRAPGELWRQWLATPRATRSSMSGRRGSGVHPSRGTQVMSPCLGDHDRWFDNCTVTEAIREDAGQDL